MCLQGGSLIHYILCVKGSSRLLLAPPYRDACIIDKNKTKNQEMEGKIRTTQEQQQPSFWVGEAPTGVTGLCGARLESTLPSYDKADFGS